MQVWTSPDLSQDISGHFLYVFPTYDVQQHRVLHVHKHLQDIQHLCTHPWKRYQVQQWFQ